MSETVKKWIVRSLAAFGGVCLGVCVFVLALWCWQGHQAFVVIQNTIAQQQAAQAHPQPPK
jgi:hypothetical protein